MDSRMMDNLILLITVLSIMFLLFTIYATTGGGPDGRA
jgi:hypothetical protein